MAAVQVLQNQYLQTETLLFYVSTKAGDPFDEIRVREDFRRLWDTGFLDDLVLDVQDTPQGKVVSFLVQERKRIQIVDYRGSKALTTTAIEEELQKKELSLKIDTFYDPARARRVEGVIRELLEGKGHPFGSVKHEAKNVGGAGVQLSFIIEDGPKARLREIDFVGNEVFSDKKLRGRMKKLREAGFFNLSWIGGKSTYSEEKWQEDREKLREFYLDHGYVMASVGEPRIEYVGDTGKEKKRKRWMKLVVPVNEGDRYRVGEIRLEGLTVLKEEGVRPLFRLRTGDFYRESRLKKGYDKLRDIYGSLGYFQWTGYTKRTPRAEEKVVDVVLTMEEDKRYYVGKIHFAGNDSTRDKVIRREVFLNEGDVFNTEALKLSIRRINQLGYFKPLEGPPEIGQSEQGEDKLDLTFKVEEQNRNQFTFGGGVSGLEGTFLNASFQTSNFLGLGETFQVALQTGKRTKNYQVAVTEPYFLDRPITAGIDVFKRKLVYETYSTVVGYTQESTGLSFVLGTPIARFTRVFSNYSYEIIKISDVQDPYAADEDETTTPLFDFSYLGGEGERHESKWTPSIVHNTVNDPYLPRSGVRLSFTPQIAGGVLGGNVDFLRPNLEAVVYLPHTRKTALGLRAEVGYIRPYGDTEELPYYQRYFLGGETQLRGFNIRSVGPTERDENGVLRAVGGNKFALFNAEYYFDVGGPVRLLAFLDAGQAFREGERIDPRQFRACAGGELRFTMPVLNVPFRLIYAVNFRRDDFQPESTFKFAVGTTF